MYVFLKHYFLFQGETQHRRVQPVHSGRGGRLFREDDPAEVQPVRQSEGQGPGPDDHAVGRGSHDRRHALEDRQGRGRGHRVRRGLQPQEGAPPQRVRH